MSLIYVFILSEISSEMFVLTFDNSQQQIPNKFILLLIGIKNYLS